MTTNASAGMTAGAVMANERDWNDEQRRNYAVNHFRCRNRMCGESAGYPCLEEHGGEKRIVPPHMERMIDYFRDAASRLPTPDLPLDNLDGMCDRKGEVAATPQEDCNQSSAVRYRIAPFINSGGVDILRAAPGEWERRVATVELRRDTSERVAAAVVREMQAVDAGEPARTEPDWHWTTEIEKVEARLRQLSKGYQGDRIQYEKMHMYDWAATRESLEDATRRPQMPSDNPQHAQEGKVETMEQGRAVEFVDAQLDAEDQTLMSLDMSGRSAPAPGEAPELPPYWLCYHCGYKATTTADAKAHFGDPDDDSAFTPLCKWWASMDDADRAKELQAALRQTAEAQEEQQRIYEQRDAAHTWSLEMNNELRAALATVAERERTIGELRKQAETTNFLHLRQINQVTARVHRDELVEAELRAEVARLTEAADRYKGLLAESEAWRVRNISRAEDAESKAVEYEHRARDAERAEASLATARDFIVRIGWLLNIGAKINDSISLCKEALETIDGKAALTPPDTEVRG